jgi:hypothetical protein
MNNHSLFHLGLTSYLLDISLVAACGATSRNVESGATGAGQQVPQSSVLPDYPAIDGAGAIWPRRKQTRADHSTRGDKAGLTNPRGEQNISVHEKA